MRERKRLKVDLQLFNEGGAATGATTGGSTTQATESGLPKADTRGSSRRKSGELSDVVYGKQADVSEAGTVSPAAEGNAGGNGKKSGVETTSNTLEERRKAFDELINGEYKDLFTEKTQGIINRRFSETKGLENRLSAQAPIVDMLMQKYQIENGDMATLQSAIEEDAQFWEELAEEKGMTVEQFKALQKLERENKELRAAQQRQIGMSQAQEQLSRWYKEAEGLKSLYPSFDFKAEAANRDFLGLLRSGLSVQNAYELIHMEEIKESAARTAAQTAGEQMQARIKAKQSRPSENGTSSQSAAIVKSDVKSLSRADRAEIARRVARGEKISF